MATLQECVLRSSLQTKHGGFVDGGLVKNRCGLVKIGKYTVQTYAQNCGSLPGLLLINSFNMVRGIQEWDLEIGISMVPKSSIHIYNHYTEYVITFCFLRCKEYVSATICTKYKLHKTLFQLSASSDLCYLDYANSIYHYFHLVQIVSAQYNCVKE